MSRWPLSSPRSAAREPVVGGEGLAEDDPAPAAVEHDVGRDPVGQAAERALPADVLRRPGLRSGGAHSDAVLLQPHLQQAELPEPVAAQRGQLAVRVGQQALDVGGAEQPALLGRRAGQRVADQVEEAALAGG